MRLGALVALFHFGEQLCAQDIALGYTRHNPWLEHGITMGGFQKTFYLSGVLKYQEDIMSEQMDMQYGRRGHIFLLTEL